MCVRIFLTICSLNANSLFSSHAEINCLSSQERGIYSARVSFSRRTQKVGFSPPRLLMARTYAITLEDVHRTRPISYSSCFFHVVVKFIILWHLCVKSVLLISHFLFSLIWIYEWMKGWCDNALEEEDELRWWRRPLFSRPTPPPLKIYYVC